MHTLTRRIKAATIALAVAGFALVGCAPSGGGSTGLDAATGTQAVEGRPLPVENPDGTEVKIAILGFTAAQAEFFKAVVAGAERAGEVLEAYDATVDYIPLPAFTLDAVNSAMRTAISQDYDAIALGVLGPANCEPIREAAEKGIVVAAIIGSADCAEESGALFFVGEDSPEVWREVVAKAMVDAVGDKECSIGILTGSFSVPQHEERRLGFIEGLAGTGLTVVNDGVEGGSDPAKAQAAARDYANAYPDLCGILNTVGDNGAVAAALTPEQRERITVISTDLTTGTENQIRSGAQYAAFTQDPFGESYNTAIMLYNAVISGEAPEGGFNQWVTGTLVTQDNLDEALRAQNEGQ